VFDNEEVYLGVYTMSLTGSGTTTRSLGGSYHEFDREWHNNEVFRGIIPCV